MSNHIAGVGFENLSALHKRLHIPFIRYQQEDEVIGQLTIPRLARNQPAELCLLLGDPSFISRLGVENVVVP